MSGEEEKGEAQEGVAVEAGAFAAHPFAAPRVGKLVGITREGAPLVDFEGNAGEPLPALCAMSVSLGDLAAAAAGERQVLLVFDRGDPKRPVMTGIIARTPAEALVESLLEGEQPEEVVVDGRRTVIEGVDEIVLRCGEASITLRRNGRVVIRGTHVVSDSEGLNRILGASIEIN